ncbi:hypothetical protein [Kitasatospora sp. A2-31]|uniref:hypothetical protein n=1 Tax=Kitasatospora sp. A2-31 TaxID=2916414 RepID=UPI001EE9FD44|nr:hypothetical protein [Kitasatospora sp. A2-31]MCG6495753.1 hypothetical protein [Kitasatospora sp. A2-31]
MAKIKQFVRTGRLFPEVVARAARNPLVTSGFRRASGAVAPLSGVRFAEDRTPRPRAADSNPANPWAKGFGRIVGLDAAAFHRFDAARNERAGPAGTDAGGRRAGAAERGPAAAAAGDERIPPPRARWGEPRLAIAPG